MRSTSFIKRGGILKDIRHLIFPQKCLSCEDELTGSENSICSICTTNFTETNFHLSNEPTMMDKIFWGRISIHQTYALFFFEKGKTTQKLLFQLKYKNNPAVGHHFGKEIGKRLKVHPGLTMLMSIFLFHFIPKKHLFVGTIKAKQLLKELLKS